VIPVIIGATGIISKPFKKAPEQYPGKARNQGTTENGDIGHCAHTSGSTNLKYKFEWKHHDVLVT